MCGYVLLHSMRDVLKSQACFGSGGQVGINGRCEDYVMWSCQIGLTKIDCGAGHMMWEVHGIGRCARSTGTVLSVKRKSVTASSVEGSSRFLCCTEMSDPPHRRQTMRCVWQVRLRTSERADICEIWLLRNHLITARQVSVAGGQRLK